MDEEREGMGMSNTTGRKWDMFNKFNPKNNLKENGLKENMEKKYGTREFNQKVDYKISSIDTKGPKERCRKKKTTTKTNIFQVLA